VCLGGDVSGGNFPDKPPSDPAEDVYQEKFLINPCDGILSGKMVAYRVLSRKNFR
jgi:hypothetical protein